MSLITIIGRGHSGTRAISNTLAASGVYMGEPLNQSWDLVPPQDMYQACRVFADYVDWKGGLNWDWQRALNSEPSPEFIRLIRSYLKSVLDSDAEHKGWKIPETTLCFPWIHKLFPEAKYIFWIRNPRDCIIGNHVTDDMRRFAIDYPDTVCERERRAISWRYQYDLVKACSKPEQWIEVRLEDFVLKQEETLGRLEEFLGFPLAKIPVKPEVVGRWRKDDLDPNTRSNYFDMFEPAMREYDYEIPAKKTVDPAVFTPNYVETKVEPYTLPELLRCQDGTLVQQQEQWPARRAEILELFASQQFGRMPSKTLPCKVSLVEEGDACDGKARRQQLRICFDEATHTGMNLLVYRPKNATGPVPAFLGLNFHGNHTVLDDPAIILNDGWFRNNADYGVDDHRAKDAGRGKASEAWSVDYIIEQGFALATAYYGDIDPDIDDGFHNGIHPLFQAADWNGRAPDEWGSIGAWAWGLSRGLDAIASHCPAIDAQRVAVIGHSRLGKTALWAAANDQRFAMLISVQAGCGGGALARRRFGETIWRITTAFPHWFCLNYNRYQNAEETMPFDQHMLLALAAPRPAYISSAAEDLWADPKGEFLALKHAEEAYALFAKQGLGRDLLPPLNTPIGDSLGYHIRPGKHAVTRYDWEAYLAFAKKHLGEK
jgi:hypothetical protein